MENQEIIELLKDSSEKLGQVIRHCNKVSKEEGISYNKELLSEAIGRIFYFQSEFYKYHPELEVCEIPMDDPELNELQKLNCSKLTKEQLTEIDKLIISYSTSNFRKVAMIVVLVLSHKDKTFQKIPDIFISQRVRRLVEKGVLESQENLKRMRFSEVRLIK